VPRRVSLPAADELFRTTGGSAVQPSVGQSPRTARPADEARVPAPAGEPERERTRSDEHSAVEDDAQPDAGASGTRPDGAAGTQGERAEPAGASEHSGSGRRRQAEGSVPGQNTDRAAARTSPAGGDGRGAGQTKGQAAPGAPRRGRAPRRPSGRERHDEKITVYVSAEELMDLEHARLVLRGEHGLAVDRGRIVREAVAVVLADLESRGDASILVRRLRGR
jgi:hypothetical protein